MSTVFLLMADGEIYTKNQINKLGNALIYLCDKMLAVKEPVSKTHLLKLVFIIEEISVKKYGIPFFDLRFDVWKLGPVSKDLFVELSDEPSLLVDFIRTEVTDKATYIYPRRPFSDDEFSDIELELLKTVSERFLYCTAGELINVTHSKNSPWYKTAVENGILDMLESGQMTTSNVEIDLAEVIAHDEQKLALYKSYKDFLSMSKSMKI
ncbi:MAG TPA: Panacea domain-containing protein [Flavitalea sp.]|nr:Panacea domain-containing protein [Flavitalea sp.]